jgi:CBS domain-containing protein
MCAPQVIQENMMKVRETMTADVQMANPNQPISAAAKMMAECDCGAIPVNENDRLAGMITDRDIAVRAVAAGKGPDTPIREVMSEGICYCYEDQDISEVASNMAAIQVRRLPVLSRDKRLVGILSLGDIAKADADAEICSQALSGISEPGGQQAKAL